MRLRLQPASQQYHAHTWYQTAPAMTLRVSGAVIKSRHQIPSSNHQIPSFSRGFAAQAAKAAGGIHTLIDEVGDQISP